MPDHVLELLFFSLKIKRKHTKGVKGRKLRKLISRWQGLEEVTQMAPVHNGCHHRLSGQVCFATAISSLTNSATHHCHIPAVFKNYKV